MSLCSETEGFAPSKAKSLTCGGRGIQSSAAKFLGKKTWVQTELADNNSVAQSRFTATAAACNLSHFELHPFRPRRSGRSMKAIRAVLMRHSSALER